MGSHAILIQSVPCLLTGSTFVAAVLGSYSKQGWLACLQGSLVLCLEGDQEAFVALLQSLRLLRWSQYDAIQSQHETHVSDIYMFCLAALYCSLIACNTLVCGGPAAQVSVLLCVKVRYII